MALKVDFGASWTRDGPQDGWEYSLILSGSMSQMDIGTFEDAEQKIPPGAHLCLSLYGLESIDQPSLAALAAARDRRGDLCKFRTGNRSDFQCLATSGRRRGRNSSW
jgi:hypothetical protein